MAVPRVPGGHPPLSSPFYPSRLISHSDPCPCPAGFFVSVPPRPATSRRVRWPRPPGGGGGSGPAWDSNAESVRPGRFRFREARGGGGVSGAREEAEEGEGWGFWRRGKRKWWSNESYDEGWDGDDDDDEDFDLLDGELEQPWEKIWIFKVFKSYGYLLPAIIASMLLATGPKAFLMALALPLGQSALSLAIDKLRGNEQEVTRRKPKSKKKPFARSASDFRRDEREEIGRDYERRETYQSWMAADAAASDGEGKSRAFGGWDELDRRRDHAEGPARQQTSKNTSSSPLRAQSMKKGKLSRRERNGDIPLFLRLLIAIFPFLGSWTRIL